MPGILLCYYPWLGKKPNKKKAKVSSSGPLFWSCIFVKLEGETFGTVTWLKQGPKANQKPGLTTNVHIEDLHVAPAPPGTPIALAIDAVNYASLAADLSENDDGKEDNKGSSSISSSSSDNEGDDDDGPHMMDTGADSNGLWVEIGDPSEPDSSLDLWVILEEDV
jgi:hypothetical protein